MLRVPSHISRPQTCRHAIIFDDNIFNISTHIEQYPRDRASSHATTKRHSVSQVLRARRGARRFGVLDAADELLSAEELLADEPLPHAEDADDASSASHSSLR